MNCPHSSVGKYISVLHRFGQSYIHKQLEEYHIGSGQYIFLIHLLFHDGIRQEDLACRLGMDKGTTARAVKKLEQEGYVRRQIDCSDQRAYQIFATQKAKDIEKEIIYALQSWTRILTDSFTEEEKKQALYLLGRMFENAQNFRKSEGDHKEEHNA